MKDIIRSVRDFNRFYVNLIGVLKKNTVDVDYSLTETRILYEINIHQQITARALRGLLTIDEGYLSRLINKLIKDKLIIKKQSDLDKRIYNLTLSEEGQKLMDFINDESDKHIENLLKDLSNQDKNRVEEIMMELKTILSSSTGKLNP